MDWDECLSEGIGSAWEQEDCNPREIVRNDMWSHDAKCGTCFLVTIWCFCVDMALHGVEGPTGIRWESEGGLRVAAVIVVRPRTMPALAWV